MISWFVMGLHRTFELFLDLCRKGKKHFNVFVVQAKIKKTEFRGRFSCNCEFCRFTFQVAEHCM